MINGNAMFNWPVSTVTINVAKEATDKDHQRLRADDEEVTFDEVIYNLREAALEPGTLNFERDLS
jgi:hypothetical protein